jgi:hypothetical protein
MVKGQQYEKSPSKSSTVLSSQIFGLSSDKSLLKLLGGTLPKCGRSPTGKCVGWHNLTEEQYAEKKAQWEAKQAAKQGQ